MLGIPDRYSKKYNRIDKEALANKPNDNYNAPIDINITSNTVKVSTRYEMCPLY